MSVLGYLDPASGSLIAATVAGGLAGVGVAAKSAWHRRTSRFRKSAPEEGGDGVEEDEQSLEPSGEATDDDQIGTDENTAAEPELASSDER